MKFIVVTKWDKTYALINVDEIAYIEDDVKPQPNGEIGSMITFRTKTIVEGGSFHERLSIREPLHVIYAGMGNANARIIPYKAPAEKEGT